MNQDLLKILSGSNEEIDNKKLMDYLSGQLSETEVHEVEKLMAESELINDAVEGLQQVKSSNNIEGLVEQLNSDLRKKLEQRKTSKTKKRVKEYPWVYLAVILILMLAVSAWFVIQRLHHIK